MKHPGALAGWRCDGCGAELCPGCVFPTGPGTLSLTACGRCGGYARPIRLPRTRVSLLSRLPQALGVPLEARNISMLVGVAAIMALLQPISQGGIVARLFAIGAGLILFLEMAIFWASCFAILRGVRRGEAQSGIERPDLTDLGSLGAAVAGTLALLPLLALANLGRHYTVASSAGDREVPFYLITSFVWTPLDTSYFAGLGERLAAAGPFWWCLGAIYLALLPMALLGCAEGGVAGLNPIAAFGRVRAVGRDYLVAAGVALLLGTAAIALHGPLDAVLAHLPYLGRWLGACLTIYPYFAGAAFLGLLGHVHGQALGFGNAEEFSDLALPGAEPRGVPPVA